MLHDRLYGDTEVIVVSQPPVRHYLIFLTFRFVVTNPPQCAGLLVVYGDGNSCFHC